MSCDHVGLAAPPAVDDLHGAVQGIAGVVPVEFLDDLEAGIAAPVNHVVLGARALRDRDLVQHTLDLDRLFDLLVVRVYRTTRVAVIRLDLGRLERHRGAVELVAGFEPRSGLRKALRNEVARRSKCKFVLAPGVQPLTNLFGGEGWARTRLRLLEGRNLAFLGKLRLALRCRQRDRCFSCHVRAPARLEAPASSPPPRRQCRSR